MPVPAIQVANELLELDPELDHMKLQKLMYYANGWWLALRGEALLEERPEVWRYGPVFRRLYAIFARFGHARIGQPIRVNPFNQGPERLPEENGLRDQVREFLQWLLQEHGRKTAIELSDETHAAGTPWRDIAERHRYVLPRNLEIPLDADRAYFREQARSRGLVPA